ncbi:MFS transporter [Parafrankia sp. FMc6]|uniref:MFS transporter n=1 Tax=Parafrankia soli TaxID=2599596 RepID=UPI0034D4385B
MTPDDHDDGGRGGPLRTYFVLRAVGALANQLLQFAVPVLVYEATGSAAWSGVALFLEWLPRLTSLPLAGPLVDRFSLRRVYVVSDGVRCAAAWLVALLVTVDPSAARTGLIVLALIAGASFEQSFVAGEKAMLVLVVPARMQRAQSLLGGIDQAMLLAGPAVGAALLPAGPAATVTVIAVLFTVSLLLARTLPRTGHPPADGASGVVGAAAAPATTLRLADLRSDLAAGVRRVFGSPVLRLVVAVAFTVNLALGLLLASGPALVQTSHGRSGSALGIVYLLGGLASMAVLAVTSRVINRMGLVAVGVCSALLSLAACTALGVAPGFGWFVVLAVAFLTAESVFTVFIRVVRARLVPEAEFGRVVGVIVLLNLASMPLAGLLVAAGVGFLPLPWLVTASGGVALVVGTGLLWRLWQLMPQTRTTDPNADRRWVVHALETAAFETVALETAAVDGTVLDKAVRAPQRETT